MNALTLAEEIINGRRITREDDLSFFLTCDLLELCEGADKIREARIGDKVDLCSIINGRSGRCPEDCKYCAQSAHHHTNCEEYDFLPEEEILAACKMNEREGVDRFSIVTAGRALTGEEFDKAIHVRSISVPPWDFFLQNSCTDCTRQVLPVIIIILRPPDAIFQISARHILMT